MFVHVHTFVMLACKSLTTISRVGQRHINKYIYIYIYIRCIHSIFGRGISKNTFAYGVYLRIWLTLTTSAKGRFSRRM